MSRPLLTHKERKERAILERWTLEQLLVTDDADDEAFSAQRAATAGDKTLWATIEAARKSWAHELEAAEGGDIEPLRRRFKQELPLLLPYVRFQAKPGQYKRMRVNSGELLAAQDVRRIMRLWKRHKKKKGGTDLAIEIAARRWDVAKETVRSIDHNRGRYRGRYPKYLDKTGQLSVAKS